MYVYVYMDISLLYMCIYICTYVSMYMYVFKPALARHDSV